MDCVAYHKAQKEDGHKYVRSYWVGNEMRHALYERINGKNKRVGTAYSEEEYMRWWGWDEETIARHVAIMGRDD